MVYANVDSGLANKKDELSIMLRNHNPDIVILNEILPKRRRVRKKLSTKDFEMDGYDFVIRSATEGRGVVIYFKTCLYVQKVDVLNNEYFEESVWIRLTLKGNDSLLIGNVYRSPSSSRENNILLNNLLQLAVGQNDTHILIVGDFNYGSLDWDLMQSTESLNHCSSLFIECIKDLFLYQHVKDCTRHRVGQSSSRLDLIFSNEQGMVTDLDYVQPLGASDHDCLVFNFRCYTDHRPSDVPRPNYYKGKYDQMRETFKSVKWENIQNDDINVFWENLVSEIETAIEKHVPSVKPSNKAKKKPWLNREALNLVQNKKKAWKKYRMCRSKDNFQKYAEARNKATRACRNAKLNYEKLIAVNIKNDSKSFWNYVRSQSKTRTGISDLEGSDGTLSSSDYQKAEMLNTFFTSVFTEEDLSNIPTLEKRSFEECLNQVKVTPEKVQKKLKNLKTSKSPGIDNIHPLLLKECSAELCQIITMLFKQSIQDGSVPDMWRKASVTPLFKKGEKHVCANYRPVSLTVILCKVLESFIRDEIMHHMEKYNLFTTHQHGFRQKHSCVTQLLEVVEEWSDTLERGGNVDCIYLDFAKAFDTVPHQRLLTKLDAYGVTGQVLRWIESFLYNRKQQVRVGSACSSWSDVKSGIPQGSVLGPVLFLVYINDLPDALENVVKLFADDTKVYRTIDDDKDSTSLQRDLDRLEDWSDKWQLHFNASKCKCMHLGKDNPNHQYSMNNTSIENVSLEKDLGVTFDSELKFNEHIALKVKKANQSVGMIRKSFTCMDPEIFIPLYKSLVRPHLEYASVIWSPTYKKDIIAVENVQRRATKMVTGLKEKTYEERLKILGLPTLYYRRDRADMVQLFKIMHEYDNVTLKNISLSGNICRGHTLKLNKSHTRGKLGQNRFSNRVVNNWNALSNSTVESSSVNVFKSNLNTDWKFKANKFEITYT